MISFERPKQIIRAKSLEIISIEKEGHYQHKISL